MAPSLPDGLTCTFTVTYRQETRAMMGPSHRLLGYFSGAAVAAAAGYDVGAVAISGAFASASAHGWLSPDIDQTDLWVKVRQVVRPWLPTRYDKLLSHRFLSHWWGLPAAAGVAAWSMPAEFAWATLMLVVGWASHLVGDFVFGEDPNGGIPLTPWGSHVGLKLDTGGLWETGRFEVFGRRASLPFAPAHVVIMVGIVGALALGVL